MTPLFSVGDRVVLKCRRGGGDLRGIAALSGTVRACYKAVPNSGKYDCEVLWDRVGRGLPSEDQLEFENPSFELLVRARTTI